MIDLFGWILVFHILATVAVIGTVFVTPVIRRSARTAGQLRFALSITGKLAILTKIGGTVLIVTGIWLMIITEMGLSQLWLNASILLSLLLIVTLSALIEPRMKKAMEIVAERQGAGEEVPAEFTRAMQKIVPLESATQLLTIAILVLMVVKPF